MTDVLISYARRDRGVAARLAARLAERGLKAVWDISELPEGALLSAARHRANAAPAVVALWSAASVKSDWVRNEAEAAAQRDVLVSAAIDGAQAPVASGRPIIDLSGWSAGGAEPSLDVLISAIADAASRAQISAATLADAPAFAEPLESPAAAAPVPAATATASPPTVNDGPSPGDTAATATFIIIAFLTLLGVAMARQAERTPAPMPAVSMDADQPLEAPVLIPDADEQNAPSGLRPASKSQESTGSVRK